MDEAWTMATAINKAEAFIEDHKLPQPGPPTGWGREYSFPTDPRALTGIELSQVMLQLAGYRGYANMLLGKQDVFLSTFTTVYEIKLGKAMNDVGAGQAKRVLKDQLRAIVLSEDDDLKKLTQTLLELQAIVKRLQYQVKIYEDQQFALSREQSRRESESRAVRV